MLKLLTLTDFQCHRSFELELDPCVTCVTGPSDRGKTALLRALRWVSLNQPAASNFVRRGARACEARLVVDGHTVTRRAGDENSYALNGQRFVSFGREVPATVAALLNVSELNFAGQFDPSFWVGDSAPKVARELNAVVDLKVIDDTLAAVAAEARRATVELEVCGRRLTEARAARAALAWVPGFVRAVAGLEAKLGLSRKHAESAAATRRALVTAKTLTEAAYAGERRCKAALRTLAAAETARAAAAKAAALAGLIRKISGAYKALRVAIPDLGRLRTRAEAHTWAEGKRRTVAAAVERGRDAWQGVVEAEGALSKVRETLSKVKRCPTCGAAIRPPPIR